MGNLIGTAIGIAASVGTSVALHFWQQHKEKNRRKSGKVPSRLKDVLHRGLKIVPGLQHTDPASDGVYRLQD